MQFLIQCLKTEEIDRRSRARMNRIRKSNLLIIDEVGYLPISETEGNLFFQLISELQEQTSIIITTNKGFEDWTEFLKSTPMTKKEQRALREWVKNGHSVFENSCGA